MAVVWMWPVVIVTMVPHLRISLTEIKPIIPNNFYCYSMLSSFIPFASFSNSKRDSQISTLLVVFHVRVLLVCSQVFSTLWGFRELEKSNVQLRYLENKLRTTGQR